MHSQPGMQSSDRYSSGTRRLGPTRGLSYSAAAPRRARLSALRGGGCVESSGALVILLYIGTPLVSATELARATNKNHGPSGQMGFVDGGFGFPGGQMDFSRISVGTTLINLLYRWCLRVVREKFAVSVEKLGNLVRFPSRNSKIRISLQFRWISWMVKARFGHRARARDK